MSIRTEKVQVPVAGEAKPMPGWLAVPEGPGPFPAVLVIEEIFGVNAHIRDVTERVAREGYVALAPDIHHRAAAGQELEYTAEGMQQGLQLIPKLSQEGVSADLAGALAFVRARSDVRGDRVGCMGFCIGGHIAYFAAATTDVRATASFYGGGIVTFTPGALTDSGAPKAGVLPTLSKTAGIKGRILCLFGGKDTMIPKAHVDAIRAELAKHDVRHEVVVYPDAGHGFFCDQRGSFDAKAAEDAWGRVKALFAEELKGS
jgi:carboxymethylenebutenolidase